MNDRQRNLFRIIRAMVVVTVAVNIVMTVMVFPKLFSSRDLSASSIGDIGRAYAERVTNGRVACIVFYEAYQTKDLVITEEAFDYLSLERGHYRSFCRVSSLTIVSRVEIGEYLVNEQLVIDVVHFGEPLELRTARFLKPPEDVDTVYAILKGESLYFIPLGLERES